MRLHYSLFLAVLLYIQHLLSHHLLLLLLISLMFLFGSNLKGFKEFKLIFTEVTLLVLSYFFHLFSVFVSFVSFFPVAANKKDSFKLKID